MSRIPNIDLVRAKFEERFETPYEVFWDDRKQRYDSASAPTALIQHQGRWEGWSAAFSERSDIQLIVDAVTEEIMRKA